MPPVLGALVAAFLVTQLATLVTSVYLHRTLSHRALTLGRPVTAVCRAVLWLTTGIRARQWVAVHRKHHAFSDAEGDPHSPIREGFAMVQFGNVALYRRAIHADGGAIVARYARDLPADRWDRALLDRAWLGLGLGIALLCLALGPWVGLLAAGLHTALYLLLNAAINAVGHMWGAQPNANRARNNQWLAWITAGEGLHNNHHAAPTSARFSLAPGQVDPAWWVVRVLERTRLARVRLTDDRVRERLAS